MRYLPGITPWLLLLSATSAWGQYGLSGSPELLWTPRATAHETVSVGRIASPAESIVYDVSPAQTLSVPQTATPARHRSPPTSSFSKPTTDEPVEAFPSLQPLDQPATGQSPVIQPPGVGPRLSYLPVVPNPALRSGVPAEVSGPLLQPAQSLAPRQQFAYTQAVPNPAVRSAVAPQSTGIPTPVRPVASPAINASQRMPAPAMPYRAGVGPNGPLNAQAPGYGPTPAQGYGPMPAQGYGAHESSLRDEMPRPAPSADCGCSANGSSGGSCGTDCCDTSGCGDCGRDPWYASVQGLFMFRDAYRLPTFSYANSDPLQTHLTPSEIVPEYRWGGEVRFGRRFCGDHWAVEGIYWGMQPFESRVQTPADVSNINLGLNAGQVQIWNPQIGLWVDGDAEFLTVANQQQYTYRSEVHNVEVNLVNGSLGGQQSEMPWDFQFTLGARFFRFEDRLSIDSAYDVNQQGMERTFANLSAADYAWVTRISEHVTNDLWGGQVGLFGAWYAHPCVRFFAGSKFGVFNNHMDAEYDIRQWNGLGARTIDTTGAVVSGYPARAVRNDIALLAQLDVGVDWVFAANWSARFGYRLVGVSGVALSDQQIPFNLHELGNATQIHHTGDLVLHGAFCGINWNF